MISSHRAVDDHPEPEWGRALITDDTSGPSFDMSGRVAIVTGASRGLGRAVALDLARAGARVLAVGRKPDDVAETVRQVADVSAAAATAYLADLADTEQCTRLFTEIVADGHAPDVLVNNAGMTHSAFAEDLSDAQWTEVIETNLGSSFRVARGFAAICKLPAAVVNVSSICAFVGVKSQAAYAASKAGISGLTRSLALEWAHRPIRVNAVAPGYFDAGLPAELFRDPDARARIESRIPLGRVASPGEVSPAVVFLASDLASYITGTTLLVDGGYTAQ